MNASTQRDIKNLIRTNSLIRDSLCVSRILKDANNPFCSRIAKELDEMVSKRDIDGIIRRKAGISVILPDFWK